MIPLQNSKKVAYLGVFLALALILSYVESLIPFYFGIPGMKLGLTNIVIVAALFLFGPAEAFFISIMRILLVGFLFTNTFSILYSLAGGLLSFLVMLLLKKFTSLQVISISVTGGVFHNVGQILLAMLVLENAYLLYYMPFLLIAGFATGFLIGIIAKELIPRLKKIMSVS